MTAVQPPGYLQAAAPLHPANLFRRAMAGIIGQGVCAFTSSDMVVTTGPGAYQVSVARGGAFVKGTDTQDQGVYFCYNDASTAVTLNNPDGTHDRIDVIIAHVEDNTEGQAGDTWLLDKVTGTPSGSPSVPAIPNSALALAHVLVPQGAGSIVSGDITDVRVSVPLVTLSGAPNCRVSKVSADQNLPDNADTPVTWDTMEFDTSSFYSGGAQNRLTVPAGLGGIYLVTAHVEFEEAQSVPNNGSRRNVKIWYDGIGGTLLGEVQIAIVAGNWSTANQPVLEVTTIANLHANHYIQISAYQDSSVLRHIKAGAGYTNLQLVKLA